MRWYLLLVRFYNIHFVVNEYLNKAQFWGKYSLLKTFISAINQEKTG